MARYTRMRRIEREGADDDDFNLTGSYTVRNVFLDKARCGCFGLGLLCFVRRVVLLSRFGVRELEPSSGLSCVCSARGARRAARGAQHNLRRSFVARVVACPLQ